MVDMGAYESVPCPADLDGDCMVGVKDLLILLGSWGPCEGCPADFDDDDEVDVPDLLFLLGTWGNCACAEGTPPLSFEEELADACLDMDDWNAFVSKMQNGTEEEKENWLCWMEHYLFDCNWCICTGQSGCPGPDPFDD